MTVKRARKQIYKDCVIVFICLVMFGSLACGAVLCSGSEGRVSIELILADCCDEFHEVPVQPFPNSCSECVDVPIYIGLVKISRVSKQLNPTFAAVAANAVVPANKFGHSAYNSASSAFEAASYFTPLCTVILLI